MVCKLDLNKTVKNNSGIHMIVKSPMVIFGSINETTDYSEIVRTKGTESFIHPAFLSPNCTWRGNQIIYEEKVSFIKE